MASMALYDTMLAGLPHDEQSRLLREAIIQHNQGHGKIETVLAALTIRDLRASVVTLRERCTALEKELAAKRGRRWGRI